MTHDEIQQLIINMAAHHAQMAPHQKQRQGGQLFSLALEAIRTQQGQLARLQKALDAATDIGIYPQSVRGGGEIDYEKRNEFMEGWNAHAIAAMGEVTKSLERGDWPIEISPPS